MKNRNLKESKGITLIALVITIIVLLILAAVSIATLTGENGILTKAQTAKKETEEGQEEEQVRLAQAEANMNDKETKYAGITIPAGMAPTRAKGENTINEGLVAVDKNGNEWVWVEVPISEIMKDQEELTFSTDADYDTLTEKLKKYADPYTKGTASQNKPFNDEWYALDTNETVVRASSDSLTSEQKKLNNGCGLTYDEYKNIYQTMLKSVYENEGFWIGRYEAGVEGSTGTDEASLALGRTKENKDEITKKAICQKDAIPYNYVTVSQAQKLASEMSPDRTKTSSLLFGIQWDLTCKFLEVKSDLEKEDINTDSKEWGNYRNTHLDNLSTKAKGRTMKDDDYTRTWTTITTKLSYDENNKYFTLLSTGASEKNKKLNIYDFAGNALDFVLQCSTEVSNKPCTFRGGYFMWPSTVGASANGYDNFGISGFAMSFRPALY